MATSNRDRVGRALDLLKEGLRPFVERELQARYGDDWAHEAPFSSDDAYRASDSAARLLSAVSAPEAEEVERQKQELLRQRFEEQARQETWRAAVAAVQGAPRAGLAPWRDVVTPHRDVA